MLERRFLGALGVALLGALGCRSEWKDVGDPCVLREEQDPRYPGLVVGDVVVQTGAEECDSKVCIAHGFQGRASCPYGQSAGAGECVTPDGDEVEVAVQPQLVRRPASGVMICSCQCAGPGPGPFCECGEGTTCVPLVADIGLSDDSVGSYCIGLGTSFVDSTYSREVCSPALGNCDDRVSGD